jgi:hypothetical protein
MDQWSKSAEQWRRSLDMLEDRWYQAAKESILRAAEESQRERAKAAAAHRKAIQEVKAGGLLLAARTDHPGLYRILDVDGIWIEPGPAHCYLLDQRQRIDLRKASDDEVLALLDPPKWSPYHELKYDVFSPGKYPIIIHDAS